MTNMTNMATRGGLPSWVRVVGVVVFGLVAAEHLWHGREVSRRHRFWHAGHAGMAAAMVAMYWPSARPLIPGHLGAIVFVAGAAVFLAVAARAATGSRGLRLNLSTTLWTSAALDMAAMAYMYAVTAQTRVITGAFVLYFVIQAVVWARRGRAASPRNPASTPVASASLERGPTPATTLPPALRAGRAGAAVAMAATLLIM
jgi:small-conductance mechanosensitive channel